MWFVLLIANYVDHSDPCTHTHLRWVIPDLKHLFPYISFCLIFQLSLQDPHPHPAIVKTTLLSIFQDHFVVTLLRFLCGTVTQIIYKNPSFKTIIFKTINHLSQNKIVKTLGHLVQHYTKGCQIFVNNYKRYGIFQIKCCLMCVAPSDLVCLGDLEWHWNTYTKVTWLIPSTHIAHKIMSDEPLHSFHHFFPFIRPLFNFQLLLQDLHILQK